MCRILPMAVGVHFEQECRLVSPILTIKSFHSKSRNAVFQKGTFMGQIFKNNSELIH